MRHGPGGGHRTPRHRRCPALPWRGRDVGPPRFPGGSRPFAPGATDDFLLAAGGKDLAVSAHQLHFLHQELEGDFAITAHLEDQAEAAAAGTHLGLMLRESLEGTSEERSFALAFTRPGALTQLKTVWRDGPTLSAVHRNVESLRGWLRIERRGDELTSWSSTDGLAWTPLLDEPVRIPDLTPRLLAGVSASKFDRTAPGLTTFTPIVARASHLAVETTPAGPHFIRADVTADGELNISDPVALLGFLFLGTSAPPCDDAADADDNGQLKLTDAIRALGFLFLGDAPPPAPFPECGVDPTGDELGCGSFPPCGG